MDDPCSRNHYRAKNQIKQHSSVRESHKQYSPQQRSSVRESHNQYSSRQHSSVRESHNQYSSRQYSSVRESHKQQHSSVRESHNQYSPRQHSSVRESHNQYSSREHSSVRESYNQYSPQQHQRARPLHASPSRNSGYPVRTDSTERPRNHNSRRPHIQLTIPHGSTHTDSSPIAGDLISTALTPVKELSPDAGLRESVSSFYSRRCSLASVATAQPRRPHSMAYSVADPASAGVFDAPPVPLLPAKFVHPPHPIDSRFIPPCMDHQDPSALGPRVMAPCMDRKSVPNVNKPLPPAPSFRDSAPLRLRSSIHDMSRRPILSRHHSRNESHGSMHELDALDAAFMDNAPSIQSHHPRPSWDEAQDDLVQHLQSLSRESRHEQPPLMDVPSHAYTTSTETTTDLCFSPQGTRTPETDLSDYDLQDDLDKISWHGDPRCVYSIAISEIHDLYASLPCQRTLPPTICLSILRQTDNLHDMTALSHTSRTFRKIFRRNEQSLLQGILSPAMWELQRLKGPSLRSCQEDLATIESLKSLILVHCRAFLRPGSVPALANSQATALDTACWRIWSFCELFRDADNVTNEIAWLQGLTPDELYDMLEIWICMGILVSGLQSCRAEARDAGIFAGRCVGVAAEHAMLEEWTYHLLTLGPPAILDVVDPAVAFVRAQTKGYTRWTPPSTTRGAFLKAAITRAYNECSETRTSVAADDDELLHSMFLDFDHDYAQDPATIDFRDKKHREKSRHDQPADQDPFADILSGQEWPMSEHPDVAVEQDGTLPPLDSQLIYTAHLSRQAADLAKKPVGLGISEWNETTVPDPADLAVRRLVSMGFGEKEAKWALARTDTGMAVSFDAALELLVEEEAYVL